MDESQVTLTQMAIVVFWPV